MLEGDLKRCGAAALVFVLKAEADLRAEAAATGALSIVVGKGHAAVCCEATQKIVKAVTLVML